MTWDENDYYAQIGRWAEKVTCQFLVEQGYAVLEPCLIERSGAPGFISTVKQIIVPDLLAAKHGVLGWFEVKYKTCPVLYRNLGRYRHGVNTSSWQAYCEVAEISGIKGWLVLVELRPNEFAQPDPKLLVASFKNLHPPDSEGHGNDGVPEVFWNRERFRERVFPYEIPSFWCSNDND